MLHVSGDISSLNGLQPVTPHTRQLVPDDVPVSSFLYPLSAKDTDIIDEAIYYFKANVFFKNYEIKVRHDEAKGSTNPGSQRGRGKNARVHAWTCVLLWAACGCIYLLHLNSLQNIAFCLYLINVTNVWFSCLSWIRLIERGRPDVDLRHSVHLWMPQEAAEGKLCMMKWDYCYCS